MVIFPGPGPAVLAIRRSSSGEIADHPDQIARRRVAQAGRAIAFGWLEAGAPIQAGAQRVIGADGERALYPGRCRQSPATVLRVAAKIRRVQGWRRHSFNSSPRLT